MTTLCHHGYAARPDFLLHEPAEVYHARRRDYLTSHQLADFRKCPQLYQQKKLGLIADDDRPAGQIPEGERDYYLERRYPAFGNLVPRDVASRASKREVDAGRGGGPMKNGVFLDFADAQHARSPECRLIHDVGTRQRTGMR